MSRKRNLALGAPQGAGTHSGPSAEPARPHKLAAAIKASEDPVLATWLANVEVLAEARVSAAPDPEAERLRAIVLANERLICGTRG